MSGGLVLILVKKCFWGNMQCLDYLHSSVDEMKAEILWSCTEASFASRSVFFLCIFKIKIFCYSLEFIILLLFEICATLKICLVGMCSLAIIILHSDLYAPSKL